LDCAMRLPKFTQTLLADAEAQHAGGSGEDDAWALYRAAKRRRAAGEQLIDLTIGAPDTPAPRQAVDAAVAALKSSDRPELW
jgi:aspartate/methionine/tyrosine aminotransferase